MKKTFTIGVLIGNANSPHTMNTMQGIYKSSKQAGVNVIFFLGIHSSYYHRSHFGENATADFDYQFNIVYDYSWFGKVDALIITYGSIAIFLNSPNISDFLTKLPSVPYILLEEFDPTGKGTSIIVDNYNGMYEIAEHLVRDHGYKNIAFLSGPLVNTDASERKKAVLDVMKKYNINFDETHIEYGDFTECSETQINILLDRFPDMEALICANDVMADTAYREIQKRGLTVGKDIAVTGFDDWEVADSLNPPLTTVQQSSYNIGYMAVVGVCELLKGNKPHSVLVPARVQYRSSCGCDITDHILSLPDITQYTNISEYKQAVVNHILPNIILAETDWEMQEFLRDLLNKILQYDFRNKSDHTHILSLLDSLLQPEVSSSISLQQLSRSMREHIDYLLKKYISTKGACADISSLLDIRGQIQELILSRIIKNNYDNFTAYQQETWFLPLITKDMLNNLEHEKDFYASSMKKISSLGAKSSYIFIFSEPIVHRPDHNWICPEHLYLAACHKGSTVYSYNPDDRPLLRIDSGLTEFFDTDTLFSMTVFCLFSGDTQYGIFVTEIPPSSLALSYQISIQIGNSIRNFHMSRQQRETHARLTKLVQEIHEKNELLNFISGYDALTTCLNRRGFLERALVLNNEHVGEQAFLIFADLDHLKEINDYYGHKEGDFAIVTCANILVDTATPIGITGRLGGDEFVTMVISPTDVFPQDFIAYFKQKISVFNQTSEKPYYIEASFGYESFICDKNISLTEILDCADKVLYENKRKRVPKSIHKSPKKEE